MARLRAATRGSALARWQAGHVASLLGDDVELVVIETTGDRRRDIPIWEMGGTGIFVKEVQAAVLDGRADFAVHSAKDLPSTEPPGLTIAAVPERGVPWDALVGGRLDELPVGGRVATDSVRRRAQLTAYRPDLTFASLRGNIPTRLEKAGEFAAIVVAAAALQRLDREDAIAEVLGPSVMLPQVSQGALAVECRADDAATIERLQGIEHRASRRAIDAERAYLAEVGGGCDLPVGALATQDEAGELTLTALLATLDGRIVLRARQSGSEAVALGRAVARELLDESGGTMLLEDLRAPLA